MGSAPAEMSRHFENEREISSHGRFNTNRSFKDKVVGAQVSGSNLELVYILSVSE